jgi:hypothetical protein
MDFLSALENSSVGTWINQSSSVLGYPAIILIHTLGLTFLVGVTTFIALRVLGFAPGVPLGEMEKLIPLVWVGLVLSASSGALLLTAKATTMTLNPAFGVKMISIVLALVVFLRMRRRMFQLTLPHEEKRPQIDIRVLAFLSIALWFTAITAGRLMAYVGEAAEFGALY